MGERIYLQGMVDESVSVTARAGASNTLAEGFAVACSNCHGEQGEGKPEAWGRPPAIGWARLFRPLGDLRYDGSVRRSYDEKTFIRAVRQGIDAGGRRLSADMPRFELRDQEIRALLAYLKQIDRRKARTSNAIVWQLASFITPEAPEPARQAVQALQRCIGNAPPMFGHRLELKLLQLKESQPVTLFIRELTAQPEWLALVAPVLIGSEWALLPALSELDLPVIGPVGMNWPDQVSTAGTLFLLFGGLREETEVLARHLSKQVPSNGRLWLVHSDDEFGRQLMQWAKRSLSLSSPRLTVLSWPLSAASNAFVQARAQFLGTDALLMLAATGASGAGDFLAGLPDSVVVGMPWMFLAGDEQRWGGRVSVVSYPWIAGQETGEGLYARWGRLSCELFLEALRRTGAQMTRHKLIQSLQTIEGFAGHDGMPALSFGFGQHMGARGAYLAPLGKGFMPDRGKSQWIDLEKSGTPASSDNGQ